MGLWKKGPRSAFNGPVKEGSRLGLPTQALRQGLACSAERLQGSKASRSTFLPRMN